jgi:hypothetical protein
MKKVLIAIVMTTFMAGIPLFAEARENTNQTAGIVAASFNGGMPAAPQFRRRYRRRMRRRHMRMRRRHYRRVMRRRRMRM